MLPPKTIFFSNPTGPNWINDKFLKGEVMSKALVVLSGGQDSTICLSLAIKKFGVKNVYAITFDYGQRHEIELDAAYKVADMLGIPSGNHEFVNCVGLLHSTSPLTSANELDSYESFEQMEKAVGDKVEKTFVPMRNTLFLTIAANRAVALDCQYIVTGICQADNANYPDCTNAFRNRLQDTFNESLFGSKRYKKELVINTPLMFMSKAESIKLAMTLPGCMEALAYSHTSYDGKYPPTDMNHSNVLRAKGFEEAGVPDPLVVRAVMDGLMPLPKTENYAELQAAWDDDVRGQDHGQG